MTIDESDLSIKSSAANDTASALVPPAPGVPAFPRLLWLWALAAGLGAGLVGSLGGEAVFGRYQPVVVRPPNWDQLSPYEKPDVLSAILRKTTPIAESKNAALAYGLLGAALGGAMGLAAGLARRSPGAAFASSAFGVGAGAATGAAMSAVLAPVFFQLLDPESGMLAAVLVHGGIWGPIGAAAGVAFGLGLGGRRVILLAGFGGLAGAVLGTMPYEVINSLAFPNARMDRPIPGEAPSRILANFCVTVFAALGVVLGVGTRSNAGSKKVHERKGMGMQGTP